MLCIPEEKYCLELLHTGNTVSVTIPIALKNSLDRQAIKKGDNVLLLGFGVGYSWGGTIIKI
jgi:3-oxoacyl-[acyl-carrier-protein] synthase-3